jgi:hypothetical protein
VDDTKAHIGIWERQPGEPNLWYARFEAFRLAGPGRSLLAAVNEHRQQRGRGRTRSVPQAWASNAKRWRWRERAEAWDESQRQATRAARAVEIEEMGRRHVQEARALQSKAVQRLRSLDQDLLSPADVVRFLMEAARLERTALGVSPAAPEPAPAASGCGTVSFSLEDAVRCDRELEKWEHDQLHGTGGEALPGRDSQVP